MAIMEMQKREIMLLWRFKFPRHGWQTPILFVFSMFTFKFKFQNTLFDNILSYHNQLIVFLVCAHC